VAPFTLLVPPVGILAAWIALGETPGAAEVAGALIVLAGLGLVTSALRVARRPAPVAAAAAGATQASSALS
jgi:O-acetylserine/cysteine efflux transporter